MRSSQFAGRFILTALLLSFAAAAARGQWWTVQTSGLDTNLRAVSVGWTQDSKREAVAVVWASGSNGVVLRSVDEGRTWQRLRISGGDALDFRGIVAFDADLAYIMSIGNGDKSRIYETSDGGETWKLQFIGKRKQIFLDAIACVSEAECFALGDPIAGKFLLLATGDGKHWKELRPEAMPPALPNEGAFAASNSSLFVGGDDIYFGTGGAATARVFHSPDSGRTWTVVDTPIAAGTASSGIFSLYVRTKSTLFASGGDYKEPSQIFRSAAYSQDGGKTWKLALQQPGGLRSGLADDGGATAIGVGPNGSDFSLDQGVTWQHADSLSLNAVTIVDFHSGWAVGPRGTIARFENQIRYIMRNDVHGNEPGATNAR